MIRRNATIDSAKCAVLATGVYVGERGRGLLKQRPGRTVVASDIDTDGHRPRPSQASIIEQGFSQRQRIMVRLVTHVRYYIYKLLYVQ